MVKQLGPVSDSVRYHDCNTVFRATNHKDYDFPNNYQILLVLVSRIYFFPVFILTGQG